MALQQQGINLPAQPSIPIIHTPEKSALQEVKDYGGIQHEGFVGSGVPNVLGVEKSLQSERMNEIAVLRALGLIFVTPGQKAKQTRKAGQLAVDLYKRKMGQ